MFLPLFIAIMLGLACPSNTNHHSCNGGTVVVNSNDPDPGNDPGDDGGDDDGGDDTGGEGSHLPPIPPHNP